MRNSIKSGINKIFGTYCGIYDKFFWKEQKKYGIPDSNKYFVIRRQGWKIGLFSYFCTNLGHIKWAVENGYTPVVDMSSYPNIYIQKGSENKINAWDYFFKQPCNVTLEDVKWHMRLLSSGEEPQEFPIYTKECLNPDTDEYKMWKAYADKYISYSDIAKEEIEKAYNLLIQKEDKVLGVLCRGTDYTSKKPHNHPVQPTAEMVIEKAESLLDNGYNKIFLATEDEKIWEQFVAKFGDKVISNVNERIHYKEAKYLVMYMPDSTQERLKQGMEYLVSMAILAKCNGFIGGRTSGTVGVMMLTKGFEDLYIWDLGLYP